MSSQRSVIAALLDASRNGAGGVLGVVVATDGSTYAKAGALLSLGSAARVGWISGGCLEPALEAEALRVEHDHVARLIDYDTRDEMDLLFGSRIGCRGLLRVALLPLRLLAGNERIFAAWLDGDQALQLSAQHGGIELRCGDQSLHWSIAWRLDDGADSVVDWQISLQAAPRVLVFGAGPETASLVPLLRDLGARIDVVERRPRWSTEAHRADRCFAQMPVNAVLDVLELPYSAVLVMNHEFELDRESLQALADTSWPWIGLLGPPRRRDDLLALLTATQRDALLPRLQAPVGIALGGRGPVAIALSIAAQLQQHWSRSEH